MGEASQSWGCLSPVLKAAGFSGPAIWGMSSAPIPAQRHEDSWEETVYVKALLGKALHSA